MQRGQQRSLLEGGPDLGDDLRDSGLLGGGALLAGSEPLAALGVGHDQGGLGGDDLAHGRAGGLLGEDGGGADGSVGLGVELHDVLGLGGGEALVPLGELPVELVGVALLQQVEVGLHVGTEDVVLVDLGLVFNLLVAGVRLHFLAALVGDNLGLDNFVAGETLLVVGDVETTVAGTLHAAKDTVAGGGADEADVEVRLEGAAVLVHGVADGEELAVSGGLAFVHVSHTLEGEQAAGEQQAGGVGGRVVGETSGDVVLLELHGVGSAHGAIALDGGENHLGDDSAVGPTDAEAVLLLVVLVLVLEDEATAGEVVGLAFAASAVLGLVSAAVSVVLENLDECHE